MTTEEYRRKSRELERKARLRCFTHLAVLGLIASLGVWVALRPGPGNTLPGIAVVAAAFSSAARVRRQLIPGSPSSDPATAYRTLLERQRDFNRAFVLWGAIPVILGCAAYGLPFLPANAEAWRNALPFGILLIVWAIAGIAIARQTSRRLQEELDELNQAR